MCGQFSHIMRRFFKIGLGYYCHREFQIWICFPEFLFTYFLRFGVLMSSRAFILVQITLILLVGNNPPDLVLGVLYKDTFSFEATTDLAEKLVIKVPWCINHFHLKLKILINTIIFRDSHSFMTLKEFPRQFYKKIVKNHIFPELGGE